MASKKRETKAPASRWMLTFADLMTNIFAFFVLLLSMSSLNEGKFKETMESIGGALGAMEFGSSSNIKSFPGSHKTKEIPSISLTNEYLKWVGEMISKLIINKNIKITPAKNGFIVSMSNELLFDQGSADLKQSAEKFINYLLETLKVGVKRIDVCGYTDDSQVNGIKFSSNWDLSAERAVNVVEYMIKNSNIDPANFRAIGFAETKPILPNISPENRSQNRRVEILIYTSFKRFNIFIKGLVENQINS
jgi:chemotaxis protein MotB